MMIILRRNEAHPKPKVHRVSVLDLGLGVEGIIQFEGCPERLLLVLGVVIRVVI